MDKLAFYFFGVAAMLLIVPVLTAIGDVSFGGQCERAGFEGAEYFQCMQWLSEGRDFSEWGNDNG